MGRLEEQEGPTARLPSEAAKVCACPRGQVPRGPRFVPLSHDEQCSDAMPLVVVPRRSASSLVGNPQDASRHTLFQGRCQWEVRENDLSCVEVEGTCTQAASDISD